MTKEINRKNVLFVTMAGAFLVPFMSSSLNVALPSIGKGFNISVIMLNWIQIAYLLTSAVFVVPFGKLADIHGRKKIYLIGVTSFTVFSLLCGISGAAELLLLFRIMQGIGSAMMFGTSVAILTSAYPPGERGKVLGLNVAVTYIGLSAGPVLGGILTHRFGWRSIFLVNIPIGILVALIIFLKLKYEWAEAKGEKFDCLGTVIYGLALLGITGGLSLMRIFWGAPMLILIGLILIFIFGIYELRSKNPVLDIKLFKNNKILTFSSLAAFINYCATFAVGYLLSLYLQNIKGYDQEHTGMILIVQPLVQAIFSPLAGRFSDKIESQYVASIGMAVSGLGLVPLIFLSTDSNLMQIVLALTLLGFGFALFSSPNTNAIMNSVEKRFYGVTSGIVGTVRLTGQTFSMGITALVFAIYLGNVPLTSSSYSNMLEASRVLFIVLVVLSAIGVFASLARGKAKETV